MNSPFKLLGLLVSVSATTSCVAQTSASAPVATPSRGTLIQTDFETGGWAELKPTAVGTIDVAGSTQASGALAGATLTSGPLAVSNAETNLGKLTLAFNLSASAAKPIAVRVESFDQNKKRTGGLETTIFPAAPDFLSALRARTLEFRAQRRRQIRARRAVYRVFFRGGQRQLAGRPETRTSSGQRSVCQTRLLRQRERQRPKRRAHRTNTRSPVRSRRSTWLLLATSSW